MKEPREPRQVTAQFEAKYFQVGPDNASEVRLYRAPTAWDGKGTHKRLPHQIKWEDLGVGDLVIALCLGEEAPSVILTLEIWHVMTADGDVFGVFSTRIVPPCDYGKQTYNAIASLVGLPPVETDL